MIKFGKEALELSPAVVRALLGFASHDSTRVHIAGIGIDEGDVCATDGHAAVRIQQCEIEDGAATPHSHDGQVFARSYVEAAAKAAKGGSVVLPWRGVLPTVEFAKLHRVEPKDGVSADDLPIGFDCALMARLELVGKACRRDKVPGEVGSVQTPPAVLLALASHVDPMRWQVGGEHWDTCIHTAFVTIMPMNLRGRGLSTDRRVVIDAAARVEKKRVQAERAGAKRKVAEQERERQRAAREEAKQVRARERAARQKRAGVPGAVDKGEVAA